MIITVHFRASQQPDKAKNNTKKKLTELGCDTLSV
jgi:hypothetical protein